MSNVSKRQQPGRIRDAVFDALLAHSEPLSVSALIEHVRNRVGEEVPASSVRSYLRLNTPGVFERVGRGQYRISGDGNSRDGNGNMQPVFFFGKCGLYQADCLEWASNQTSNSVHAIVTDPPYGLVEYDPREQQKRRSGKGGVWRIPPAFDGARRSPLPRFTTLSEADLTRLRDFFLRWGRSMRRILVPGGHLFIASNPLVSYIVSDALVSAGFERRGEVIRLVQTMRGGDRPKNAHEEFREVTVMPRSMWEPWLLFRRHLDGRVQDNLRRWGTGGLRRVSESQPFGDVIRSSPTRRTEREIAPHPSLKPQAFMRQIVRASLPLGRGIVLDPFAGAGSTLAAAEAIGYRSIGVEIDKDFVRMARKAIEPLSKLVVPTDPSRSIADEGPLFLPCAE